MPNEEYYLNNIMIITCIVERGKADDVVEAAKKVGAKAATIYYARGTGIRERLGLLGIAIQPEKEIIEIAVHPSAADAVFDAMIDAGKLHLPGKGFIYMTQAVKAYTYIPKKEE
ncbi:P-II family nitrogen regulator [Chrysiogenes arsenatis]|uniref:P-II family nitrogen regulator n=1 Tax=Chrysiogenes arsenatis TaxID=309797 RepID=UPI0004014DEB|nr:P-II family nitrogen regulator [Chrysiogenes arsenatis]